MFVSNYQSELEYCLARAAEVLDGPARPVWFEWSLQCSLERQLVPETRSGLGREPPVVRFDRSKRGHEVFVGIERFRWETPDGSIRLAKVGLPGGSCPVDDFWAVRAADYEPFCRMVRQEIRRQESHDPPVMPEADRRRLWNNTIGFLLDGRDEMARYGVTPRRGVLLLGSPGNGKTTACRWLAGECRVRGLQWQCVTASMYDDARRDGDVRSLFRLGSPGIVLFDDFDRPLRDHQTYGESDERSTFLTELDGVEQPEGVVTMFTSNAALEDLDPAMMRPGRIDVVVHFPKPSAALRRGLIQSRWHPDLVAGIELDVVVAETSGFSFAELEEAKKLLVLNHVHTGEWDWPGVRRTLRHGRTGPRRPIGFTTAAGATDSQTLSASAPLPR